MKYISQSEYWNNSDIVKEFTAYEAPLYWQQALLDDYMPGKKVLDIGCGGGRNSLNAFEKGYEVFACDAHESMVETTKRKLLAAGMNPGLVKTRVLSSVFSKLCYDSDSFDIVISSGVLHNCDNAEEFEQGLQEISRVLKPGGHLYLNVFIRGNEINNLVSTDQDCLFLNSYGLPVWLFSRSELMERIACARMQSVGDVHYYVSHINEGQRTVMRGVFVLR